MIYLRSETFRKLFAVLLLISVQWLITDAKLSACSKAKEGNQTLYRKVSGDDGIVICIKNDGKYRWKSLDGSSTLGERFNPANDCSDIVDNLPRAKDGFYWIIHSMGKRSKAWCDTHRRRWIYVDWNEEQSQDMERTVQ